MTMLVTPDAERRAARPSRSLVALAGVAALAVVAAAGWLLGAVVRPGEEPPAPHRVVKVGPMRVEITRAWASLGGGVYAPVAGMPARAELVTGPPADETLVPTGLRALLPLELPPPKRTKLAGLPAWRYGPIQDGTRVAAVTLVPTTVGVLAIACSAPQDSWSAAAGCDSGVRAVAVDGTALEPAPDLAFRARAGAALRALDAKRVAGRRAIAKGRRAAGAHALARAHRAAAAELAPVARIGTLTALRRTAAAYDRLATATTRPSYIAARAAVRHAETALARALRR